MEIADLVDALFRDDLLAARQWIKDARRAGVKAAELREPVNVDPARLAAAAALVELLALREPSAPPEWTRRVGAAPRELWLDAGARLIPALRRQAEAHSPEPLQRRRIFALPDFLSVV